MRIYSPDSASQRVSVSRISAYLRGTAVCHVAGMIAVTGDRRP
jgi:hypothetical protein